MAVMSGAPGTSGYLLGNSDPYRKLRKDIRGDIRQTPLDPRQSPLYNEYARKLQEQVATDYASRGLGDSGLGVQAGAEAETGLYANLYDRARAQRASYYGIQAGIPYLRNYGGTGVPGATSRGRSIQIAGLGGGGGGLFEQGQQMDYAKEMARYNAGLQADLYNIQNQYGGAQNMYQAGAPGMRTVESGADVFRGSGGGTGFF